MFLGKGACFGGNSGSFKEEKMKEKGFRDTPTFLRTTAGAANESVTTES